MSSLQSGGPPRSESEDPWEELADHREALEMCIEENTPFAEDAEKLLDRLEEEGY